MNLCVKGPVEVEQAKTDSILCPPANQEDWEQH